MTTAAPLPARAPLVIRFCLPGDDTELCLHAHVAWSRATADGRPGVGVAFDDADARAELAARLERWAELREIVSRSDPDGV